MRSLVPLLLVACSAQPLESLEPTSPVTDSGPVYGSPDTPLPPPGTLSLSVDHLYGGADSTFTVLFANPGDTVTVVRGTPGAGPCPPPLLGLCLDVASPKVVGSAVANAVGAAEIVMSLPVGVPHGVDVTFQAVMGGASPDSSNLLTEVLTGCGDGVQQDDEGEICDDGNTVAGDGCDDQCQYEPYVFVDIAAGYHHACGLEPSGQAVCWGSDLDQNLTLAYDQASPPPTTFRDIEAGGFTTCGIEDGTDALECWGQHAYTPGGTWLEVGVGHDHGCALDTSGVIDCWGDNSLGQTAVPAGLYVAVSAGYDHTCALDPAGSVVCWGQDGGGQVSGAPAGTFVDVAGGAQFSCALDAAGAITCWGDLFFVTVPTGTWTDLSGHAMICSVETSQEAECFGSLNGYGEQDVPAGPWDQIASGTVFACGLHPDGTAECWGRDNLGQATAP